MAPISVGAGFKPAPTDVHAGYDEPAKLPQARVDLFKHSLARAELVLGERVERARDRVEVPVEVLGLTLDVNEAGDDLAFCRVPLQEGHGAEPVMRVVIGGELLEHELRAIVLLDDLDLARLVGNRDRHAGG